MDQTTFLTILATAIITNLGAAGVTWIGHKLTADKESTAIEKERTRHASYLAIRVVTNLDHFVIKCREVLADEGAESEGIVYPTAVYPTLSYPDDVDWRSIPPALMYRILALPNALDAANRDIDFVGEHVAGPPNHDDLFDAQNYHFSKLGIAALDLADAIRVGYAIPALDSITYQSPRPLFERHTVDEDRRRRNAMSSIEALVGTARSTGAETAEIGTVTPTA